MNTPAGGTGPARVRSAAHGTSPPRRAASAGVAPRSGRHRSADGIGREGCRRSAAATARARARQPVRSPGACRRVAGRSRPPSSTSSPVTRKVGRARRARSVNSSTASSCERQRGHAPRDLAGDTDRFAAGGQDRQPRAGAQQRDDHVPHASSRCSQLSSSSSICRSPTNRTHRLHRSTGRAGRAARASARRSTGTTSGSVIGARSTYHTPSRNSVGQLGCHLDGKPRLARAACAGQRHQPVVAQTVGVPRRSAPARPTKRRQLRRKVMGANGFARCASGGNSLRISGVAQVARPVRAGAYHATGGCRARPATHRRAADHTTKSAVAPDNTVWPPCAKSRSRAVRLIVGPM